MDQQGLTQEHGDALKQVLAHYSELEREARYRLVERIARNRAYQKNEVADFFDPVYMRWRPFHDDPEYKKVALDEQRKRHHINVIQPAWQVLQGALSTTGVPGSVFTPQNKHEDSDKQAARVAKPIADYLRDQNRYKRLWLRSFRYQYTDGLSLIHVAHMRSGKWGTVQVTEPTYGNIVIKPAGYRCPECQELTPLGQQRVDEWGISGCAVCGSPVGEENLEAAEDEQVQIGEEQKEIPAGREIVKCYGVLESRLPFWCDGLEDAPYAAIELNVDRNSVSAVFGDLEEQIQGSSSTSTDDERGDFARRMSISPAGAQQMESDLCIYRRWWLRPEAFLAIRDAGMRAEIQSAYREGALLILANDVVLNCRPERMDDHLILCRTFDSDGMYPTAIVDPAIPVQKATETKFDLGVEGEEFATFPPVLYDDSLLSKTMKKLRMRAAQLVGITVPAGKTLKDSYHQMQIKDTSSRIEKNLPEARSWLEFLVGAEPALAGGAIKNVRTAQGYETAKNQALQRLGPPYQAQCDAFAEADELGVHEFLTNRTDDEFRKVVGQGMGTPQQVAELLSPRNGRIYAKCEMSEAVPSTWAQVQTAITRIIDSQNPNIQAWSSDPNNSEVLQRALAIPGLVVPGKSQRDKALKLIPMLRQGVPIAPDPLLDNLVIHIRVMQEWAAGDEALDLMVSSPLEFQAVRNYVDQASTILAKAAAPPPQAKPTDSEAKPDSQPVAA